MRGLMPDLSRRSNDEPLLHKDYAPRETSAGKRAVVSTLYSNSFAIATAVLGHSARAHNVSARLMLPYLYDRIGPLALCITRAAGWEPIPVPHISPPHNGKDIHDRFKDQYTKLNIWALDKLGIETVVYLDSDTLVRRNFDELFDLPFNFAAVPDVYGDSRGFSLTFNAGVLVLRTSSLVLDDMVQKIKTAAYPLQQAEQAFLNLYYGATAVRLPYAYNANLAIKVRSPEMYQELKHNMRIVHYTMMKPFLSDTMPSTTILTLEEMEVVMTNAELEHEMLYREEAGWWREAYERMMKDIGEQVSTCYSQF
ncbi:hypothetical protein HWV62_36941 [Athelia sp. TMB]|nr:hypothetical protein HWV62_36941 [Athelia sp. TMB]